MTKYIIASSKNWFREHPKSDNFRKIQFHEISSKDDLNLQHLELLNPRYIFFPHWSWKVPSEIYEKFECIAFHTAPLPFGRGGSPIQNLILHGLTKAPVCALRMTGDLDAGPIYSSIEISLDGNVEQIFRRMASSIEKLIIEICNKNPIPKTQTGNPVVFQRLTPAHNEILPTYSPSEIFDRIRMVDGLDYPRAYIVFGGNKLELTNAQMVNGELVANVKLLTINPTPAKEERN